MAPGLARAGSNQVLIHVEGSDRLKLQGWVTGKVSVLNRNTHESKIEERREFVEVSVAKLAGFDRFSCTQSSGTNAVNADFMKTLRETVARHLEVTGKIIPELLRQAFINRVTGDNDWESVTWVHPEFDSILVESPKWAYEGEPIRGLASEGGTIDMESLVDLTLVQTGRCDMSAAELDLAAVRNETTSAARRLARIP